MPFSLKPLKRYVATNYGRRCKDYEPTCVICRIYVALDDLTLIMDERRWKKWLTPSLRKAMKKLEE